jgi:hypothetical protein
VIKLKNILKESFAWERKADGSLPTIADTTAAYEAKMREQAELNMPDMDDEDEVDEAAKPDYIDADGDGNEKESMKKAFADKEKMAEGSESNLSDYSNDALRDMKINLARFEGNEEDIKDINRELERRKNDKKKTNESTLIKKGGLQEMREIPLEQRILRNLKGNDYILRETFKK